LLLALLLLLPVPELSVGDCIDEPELVAEGEPVLLPELEPLEPVLLLVWA